MLHFWDECPRPLREPTCGPPSRLAPHRWLGARATLPLLSVIAVRSAPPIPLPASREPPEALGELSNIGIAMPGDWPTGWLPCCLPSGVDFREPNKAWLDRVRGTSWRAQYSADGDCHFGGNVSAKSSPCCTHSLRSSSDSYPSEPTSTQPFMGLPVMSNGLVCGLLIASS